jgi:hypothetical protein
MEVVVTEESDGMSPYGEHEDLGVIDDEYFVADLRAAFERPAAPEVANRHLTAMRGAARDLLPPVTAEAAEAPFWTWPRRVGAAVAALAVALFGLGGLGMAGALPGPMQDFVSSVADHVGLDVPKADGTIPGRRTSPSDPGTTGAPGQAGSTPGQAGETPATGAEAPGQAGTTPGQSGTAPGQVDNPSATAPGQVDNPSATAPGQVNDPSATAPGQSAGGNPNAGSGNNSGNANGNANPNAGSGNNNAGGNGKGATTTTLP